jgi:hypothetical protein
LTGVLPGAESLAKQVIANILRRVKPLGEKRGPFLVKSLDNILCKSPSKIHVSRSDAPTLIFLTQRLNLQAGKRGVLRGAAREKGNIKKIIFLNVINCFKNHFIKPLPPLHFLYPFYFDTIPPFFRIFSLSPVRNILP